MRRLESKVALVTGAAQGIGAAIARRFAEEGAAVVLADLDLERAGTEAASIARDTGAHMLALPCDVADPAAVERMHAEAERAFGQVGILVNNAGVNVFREPLVMTPDDWRRCLAVDLEGAWHCSRAVLPGMLARGEGSIINIISNHAFTVIPGTFPYPVAKHGLLGMTRALGLEYARRGVRVNAVSPGFTETRLAKEWFDAQPDPAKARAETEAKQPPGRLCRPEEVAAVAALLASDEAAFIIGENIVVDGGVSIRMYE
jgi:NAD(P)-dependent dehydrogenase (short-subunit alcohol dehydrogenase family)